MMLTPEGAAELLQVSPATVRDWARRGLIPGRRFGRLWRFDKQELEGSGCSTAGEASGGSVLPSGDARSGSRVAQIAASLRKNLSNG